MNNSLLKDENYITFINNIIDYFKISCLNISPQIAWELLKSEIKSCTIQFCTEKNKYSNIKHKNALKEIERISNLLVDSPECQILNEKLNMLKFQKELYDINTSRGAQVRSRIKYIEEGEKNTKLFLNLEKARGANNTIYELNTNLGKAVDPVLIVDSDLYKRIATYLIRMIV